MTKLKRKDKRDAEGKAYKLVKKFGISLDDADIRKMGGDAYMLELVLRKLHERFVSNPRVVTDEENLAYCCLQVARRALSNSLDPEAKALGLSTIASAFDNLYREASDGNIHMKLVKHGLRHIREHMEPMIPKAGRGKWTRYGAGGGDGTVRES